MGQLMCVCDVKIIPRPASMETFHLPRLPTSKRLRRGRRGNEQLFWWVWASAAGGFDEEWHFYEWLFLALSSESILPEEMTWRMEASIILALVTILN